MLFTAGLDEPLKTHVELQKPGDLEEAMDLARAYKRLTILPRDAGGLTTAPRSAALRPTAARPFPMASGTASLAPLPAGSVASTGASGATRSSATST